MGEEKAKAVSLLDSASWCIVFFVLLIFFLGIGVFVAAVSSQALEVVSENTLTRQFSSSRTAELSFSCHIHKSLSLSLF